MLIQQSSNVDLCVASPTNAVSATTIFDDTTRRHVRKYQTRNPLQRWLLHRFHRKAWSMIQDVAPNRVLDFGCGEAFFWQRMCEFGSLPQIVGLDLREEALETARELLPDHTFECRDLFDYEVGEDRYDLVVASEVLEHLYEPEKFLHKLTTLTQGPILLTVPHEPWFRASNFLRGRDLLRFGNHPEHVQQWSVRSFRRFVSPFLEVVRLETSFPFILLLGQARQIH